jgi:RNA polymerase sigma-70 factor (ECF subfamily)
MSDEIAPILKAARQGDSQSLGQLMGRYQRYLQVLAQVEIGRQLQGKVDAADVVQEVFLQAHRSFPNFRGASEGEFSQWLRTILATTLANTLRHYLGTQARDLRLEQQMNDRLNQSAVTLNGLLVDPHSSPSQHVANREQSRLVIEALSRLPGDYQAVLTMRHLEGLTFPAIAERMERSVDSVEKLWLRGLAKLKKEFTSFMEHSQS